MMGRPVSSLAVYKPRDPLNNIRNMKLELFFALAACAVFVYSENCTTNSNCANTNCGFGFHIVCEHKDLSAGVVMNGGLCTCAADDQNCITREDCLRLNGTDALNCQSNRRVHCYDNKCICSRW